MNNKEYEERLAIISAAPSPTTYYPHRFHVTIKIPEFNKRYSYIEISETLDVSHTIAGRIMVKRGHGKLYFYVLESEDYSVQLMCSSKNFKEEEDGKTFKDLHKFLSRGDIVGAVGLPTRTKSGELSLSVVSLKVLAPCIRSLPSCYYSLTDIESRYRNRHLDLILNTSVRNIFRLRSKTLSFIRAFLDSRDFMEVETPILASMAGGATARPFDSYLHDMKMPLVMRIAPELYLKKLIVGGFPRVYEIGKNFRNEGIDGTHNPEFTSLEFYEEMKDYRDGMEITETMLSSLVYKLFGSYELTYKGEVVSFKAPFERISFLDAISERAGFEMPEDLTTEETRLLLLEQVKKHGIPVPSAVTTAKLLDKLCGKFIEDRITNPTFIMEHPQIMSPLAKYHRSKKNVTERFELFVGGFEVANAYTELNNPIVQRRCFAEQSAQKEAGDNEVPPTDEDYCVAMEYGMPPMCGIGIGIERIMMIFANKESIKEVILFPLLKELN